MAGGSTSGSADGSTRGAAAAENKEGIGADTDVDATANAADTSSAEQEDEAMLSQLMTALATGARAVQGLPLEDDFEYQSSFPEVEKILEETHSNLLELLMTTLGDLTNTITQYQDSMNFTSLDDPLLWEACTDVCDALLEQASTSSAAAAAANTLSSLTQTSTSNNKKSFGRLIQGIVEMEKPQLNIPGYYDNNSNNNNNAGSGTISNTSSNKNKGGGADSSSSSQFDRRQVFIPPIIEKYHATVPLDLTLQPGHGLEDRFGGLRKVVLPKNNDNSNAASPIIVAPESHVPHVYQTEIENLQFPTDLYQPPESKPPKIIPEKTQLTATWVDTPEALQALAKKIELNNNSDNNNNTQQNIIAMDLEAHSYRSFAGITCLIQLTTFHDHENYLIDPFPLWNEIGPTLGPILANPNIIKVLHGADSDIQWLQRDFGLYIVNLFDTGRAARALKLSSAGYAYLLQHYANVTADKTHQLSDWRQRPLPQAMKEYAIMDTHYLVDILPHLLYDLKKSKLTSIQEVFEESKKVSLIRYAPEPFKPEGYRVLMSRRGTKTELNKTQELVLKELWDWRDFTARENDESLAYVCNNMQLMRIAMACPTSLTALQNLLQPMPPLILRNSKKVLTLIQRYTQQQQQQQQQQQHPPSSAFFKPATADRDSPRDNRLLSPVLGTEALYRQAGWISPHHPATEDIVTTTDDDDDDMNNNNSNNNKNNNREGIRPRRVLAVHETNKRYRANQFSSHSLQLSNNNNNRNNSSNNNSNSNAGNTASNNSKNSKDGISIMADNDNNKSNGVDGMGTVRATHPQGSIEEAARLAQTNADRIRKAQQEHGIIVDFMSPADVTDLDGDDDHDDVDDADEMDAGIEKSQDQEDFSIPRSMREIYRISNRNRRNKKGGGSISPPSAELSEKERMELEKADEILKARTLEGKNYYDEIAGSPKRQRTKSTASMSSDDAGPGHDSGSVSRDDDIAVMQEIGWISGKEEADAILKQQQQQQQANSSNNNNNNSGSNNNNNGNDEDESSEEEGGGTNSTSKGSSNNNNNNNNTSKPSFDYSNIGAIGALSATPSANPFFAGAATAGGHLNNNNSNSNNASQASKEKKKQNSNRGKQSRRQVERPERREGRSQVYKKR